MVAIPPVFFLLQLQRRRYTHSPMTVLRTHFTGLTIATLLCVVFVPTTFAQDASCLQRAVDRRQKDLRDAYSQYADSMGDAVGRLSDDEIRALDQDDRQYQQTDTSSAQANFSYAVTTNWQQLSTRLFQAWNDYHRERYQCGFSQSPPPAYGGSNGYNYNYQYSNYGTRAYCTQPVLSTPPAGCAYECAQDSNGCQRCRLACRTPVSYSSCNCPSVLSPVCTRDNRTYDNACLAICAGREVWHTGSCY